MEFEMDLLDTNTTPTKIKQNISCDSTSTSSTTTSSSSNNNNQREKNLIVDDTTNFQTITISATDPFDETFVLCEKEEETNKDFSIFLINSFGEQKQKRSSPPSMPYSESAAGISNKSCTSVYSNCTPSSSLDYDEDNKIIVRKTLVEGWIYKKGSGYDLFISKRWKKRWAELALVKIPGDEVDVPALLISWDRESRFPSTYLPLVKAIVVPLDKNTSEQFSHRFTVIPDLNHDPDFEGTRVFSVPMRQRDEWVHLINIAIADYERQRSCV